MNGKSIFYSILSLVLLVAVIFADVFLFKVNIAFGFLGILLLLIPAACQRKALAEADGGFDKIFAKYILPILATALVLAAILALAFWIKIFG